MTSHLIVMILCISGPSESGWDPTMDNPIVETGNPIIETLQDTVMTTSRAESKEDSFDEQTRRSFS